MSNPTAKPATPQQAWRRRSRRSMEYDFIVCSSLIQLPLVQWPRGAEFNRRLTVKLRHMALLLCAVACRKSAQQPGNMDISERKLPGDGLPHPDRPHRRADQ